MRQREELEAYAMISLAMIGLFVFVLGPVAASIAMSLTKWNVIQPPEWIGAQNYVEMSTDKWFWHSLWLTTVYSVLGVPLAMAWGFAIAMLMNQGVRWIALWRTIYYLPAVISGVVMSLMWMWLFNPDLGLVNGMLVQIGVTNPPRWLADPDLVLPTLILLNLWRAGGHMVIYLAGLQGIPTHLYEAASIDGATALHRFWHVTIPMMSPVILFELVMGVIASFQVFAVAFIATQGGPADATLFYVLYLYRKAFQYFDMGYASALACILFLIILGLTAAIMKYSGRWVYYAGVR
jgi:multiple sugar transport system permease protein